MIKGSTGLLDLKKFLPYRLSVLEQQISKDIANQYIDKFNLTRMEWRVMSTLAMFDGVSARDICAFTHMEKMQVSRAIAGLVNGKLVQQKKNPEDQRRIELSLTPKGFRLYQKIVPLVLEQEQRIFSVLNASELKQFHKLINKLCLSLDNP